MRYELRAVGKDEDLPTATRPYVSSVTAERKR